jgi:hypothetical protein
MLLLLQWLPGCVMPQGLCGTRALIPTSGPLRTQSSVFIKSYAPIVSLHFSQSSPYRYAVTSGTRLQIYNSKTNRVVKTISKFKELARSGTIRDDGNLVIAADDSGLVQVGLRGTTRARST